MVNLMSALRPGKYLLSRKRFLRPVRILGISLFVVILCLGIGSWLGVREVRADVETPSTPTVTSKSSSSIWISWSAVASYCHRFEVQYRRSGHSWGGGVHWTSIKTYQAVGLRSATTYQFRVRGQDGKDETDDDGDPWCSYSPSNVITDWSGTRTVTTNTSAPYLIGLSSPEQTPNSITVAWSAPYNGGSAITGYEVQYRLSGDTVWTAWSETIAADATSLTVTDLLVSRAYQFQGRAVSDVGKGSWSSALNRSTKSPPEQVTGLVLSSSDETNLSISWQRPSSLEAIVRYEIEYRENTSDNSATWTRRTTEASVLSITIGDDTALTLDTSYEIRVRAVSSQGSGLWSVLLFAATAAGPEEPASFGTQMVSNQGYVQGESITDLVFPEATSGSGTKTYRLTPALPGLNFDTATRTISGTPTQANTHNMTYTVSNSVGSDSLSFIIAVAAADTAPSFGSSTLATQTFQKAVDIGKVQLPRRVAVTGRSPIPLLRWCRA